MTLRLSVFVALAAGVALEQAEAATIRSDGLLQVDGQAMFPIGLVELGIWEYSDWNERIRSSKANIVWDVEFAYANAQPTCAAVIDSAEAANYSILAGSSDTWYWDDPATPELEVDQSLYEPDEFANLLDCISGSARVVGFANRDEASWVISNAMVGDVDTPHVLETYAQIHAAVPNTFVAINHAPTHLSMNLQAWIDDQVTYRPAADVHMFACYPYPSGPGTCEKYNVLGSPDCKMDRLPIGADLLRLSINGPGQPLWMILQAYKSIPLREARWEAYAALIHGAKGILWAGWNWTHSLGDGAESWLVTRQVVGEIAEFHPFLVRNDVSGIRTSHPNVEAAGKRLVDRSAVVFAISREGFAGTASIYLPGAANYRVFLPHEGNRSLEASNGWITDHFDSYEGHAYRYDGAHDSVDPTGAADLPTRFGVEASPNPSFGPTRATFTLPREGAVVLTVYDSGGRRIAVAGSGTFVAGRHEISWNGRDAEGACAAPGLYFIRGETAFGETATAKVAIRR